MSNQLAIRGGVPVRKQRFTAWPIYDVRESHALEAVLESRNWGGYPCPNDKAREFGAAFAAEHDARYGVAVANGTVSLELALKAAGTGFGDEVIVPAYTWEGTAAAVLFTGAVPVFVDVDPGTYCLDPALVEAAITPKTKAIIPVHLGFRFADMDRLTEIAERHGLFLLEDCAHAHGGKWNGKGAGSIGQAGSFSFQTSKLMTAGEGGIVITSDIDLADQVIRLANCGRPARRESRDRPALGHNYRMTEFQAAILLAQLERLPEQTLRRENNIRVLERSLGQIEGISLLPRDPRITRQASYHYVFKFHSEQFGGIHRNAFVAALKAEGIPCDGRFYEAVYLSSLFQFAAERYPAWQEHSRRFDCPVAVRAGYEESVWLPHEIFLDDEQDVHDVATAIEKIIKNIDELRGYEDERIRIQGMSRAERALLESKSPY
ncbi:MAG: DegT/DnrJ/EryC1/StrS family aminotransferase [Acidobacteriota bacterium]|nr:MAG: DegT/DnrJ/EryC1/StrS family aminotransferase [Acidobacteriota bacterium]